MLETVLLLNIFWNLWHFVQDSLMNRKLKKNSIDNKLTYWNDFWRIMWHWRLAKKADENSDLHRPLTQDECENRFYLWNIMVYLKNTVAKWIGFLALIWCYYSKNLGQSVSQSRILIVTSDTQTSRASGSTKCRHYAALLTKLKVWWSNFLMFNRGLDYRS